VSLGPEDRQCCGDPVEISLEVHVDHVLPILDAEVVEGGDGADARVVHEAPACGQKRRGLSDPAAGTCDYYDLAFDF
jgi:hypothetical protein